MHGMNGNIKEEMYIYDWTMSIVKFDESLKMLERIGTVQINTR